VTPETLQVYSSESFCLFYIYRQFELSVSSFNPATENVRGESAFHMGSDYERDVTKLQMSFGSAKSDEFSGSAASSFSQYSFSLSPTTVGRGEVLSESVSPPRNTSLAAQNESRKVTFSTPLDRSCESGMLSVLVPFVFFFTMFSM
jgi:hypothetical protein